MVWHAPDRTASLDTVAMMPRVFRNAAYFIAGIMLAFLVLMPFAHAETIAATATYPQQQGAIWNCYNLCGMGANQCSSQAACKSAMEANWPQLGTATSNPDGSVVLGPNTSVPTCPDFWTYMPGGQCVSGTPTYSCPATGGWTLSGSSCTRADCQSGTYRSASGECLPVGQCPLGQAWSEVTQGCVSCSSVSGGGQSYSYSSSARDASGNVCVGGASGSNGCYLATTGTNVCVGSQCYGNLGAGTGAGCVVGPQAGSNTNQTDPASPAPPSNDSQGACTASGGYYGTVNGQPTCVPASSTTPVTATTKTNTTTTTPTNTTTTTSTKTTSVSNSVATTTTVTQTTVCDPNGQNCSTTNSTSTGTGSTYDPQDLCAKHPDIPACRHWCEDHPDKVACKSLNELIPDPTTEQEPGTKQLGVTSITLQSFGGAGSCPGSISVTHGAYLSFDWICNLMGAVKPMLLALAWLSAGLITIGAFRDG